MSATLIHDASPLALVDLSSSARYGCKGPGAADWIAHWQLPVPLQPNTAVSFAGGIVLRLGLTEFLVDGDADVIAAMQAAARPAGVYPVLREDCCIGLSGACVHDLLRQVCNVDFVGVAPGIVVLTSMAGVSVTVLCDYAAQPSFRIWCDGTFGVYLSQTLTQIAAELSGPNATAPC